MEPLYVIACATVSEELRPFLPPDTVIKELRFGLHRDPAQLRDALQQEIDAAPAGFTVLLGYGLCGGGADGLRATHNRLVIPRTHDCIALFLGSREAHQRQIAQEIGTYYLTKGWIEVDSLWDQWDRLTKKYGPERGAEIARMAVENYTRMAFIATGASNLDHYRETARQWADMYRLRYDEIEGSPIYLEALAAGAWDERFIIVEPGETIRLNAFL